MTGLRDILVSDLNLRLVDLFGETPMPWRAGETPPQLV